MSSKHVQGLGGRRYRFNIGILVFVILFAYVIFSAFTSFKKNKINFYEVTEGSMTPNTEHLGIIVRKESVMTTPKAGYVNYFVSAGKKVRVGSEIYSIDETGAMNSFLSSNSLYDLSLSSENARRLQKSLRDFSIKYSDNSFTTTYDAKASINSTLLEFANVSGSDAMQTAMEQSGISFSREYAPVAGVLGLNIDGFEERDIQSITEEDFNKESYHVEHMNSGKMVATDSPVCKIITDENWEIVFRLSDEDKEKLAGSGNLKIKFKGSSITADCEYQPVNSIDGNTYGRLYLNKYMVDYINDRYITFNIEDGTRTGLKIPKSAVVTKTFLTIPEGFLARGGDDTGEGFYKEVYTEAGTSIVYIPTTVYYSDSENYYIDFSSESDFQPGDYVVRPGTNERYKLGVTASLDGVYNINKGYTVFRQIDVLDSNDEYYIVRKNQKYGLNVYDHILFDPTDIHEGDFIYQ
ncbi:MAG: HlyD family efflux transporter periplasmic adaptor subunit [Lachnospiraceae bacterium]|nr:HlyD family efflux transporter periplasmic adaptor subunit [Lachnospiraceae bacterium]